MSDAAPALDADDPRGLDALRRSTDSLLQTAVELSDTELQAPSLLPGWTRGHVLAHVAGNATSLTNLARWAATGVETPQYESQDARDRAIEHGSREPGAVLVSRIRGTANELSEALAAIPDDRLDAEVQFLSGRRTKAKRLVATRRREVEIHHVDLVAGFRPSDWPADFVDDALGNVSRTFDTRPGLRGMTLEGRDTGRVITIRGGGPPILTAPDWRLLAWLTGRDDGRYLVVTPAAPPPTLPTWA